MPQPNYSESTQRISDRHNREEIDALCADLSDEEFTQLAAECVEKLPDWPREYFRKRSQKWRNSDVLTGLVAEAIREKVGR